MDQTVRFGDIVCIGDPSIGGFLCGDFSNSGSIFLDKQKRFNPTRSPHDLSECRFIVVQKLQYAAVKAYEKRIRLSGVAGLSHSNWQRSLEPIDALYKDLAQDLKRMQDESETNKMEFKRKAGQPVTYGSIVQLKHYPSKQYLTQTKNRAEVDRLSMELQLRAAGSEGSWWKVLPSGKVRKEGEHLHYGESIQLENAKFFSSLMNVSAGEPICSCVPLDVEVDTNPKVFMQLHQSGRCRFEVNASAMGSQLVLHRLCGSSYILRSMGDGRHGAREGRPETQPLRGLQVVTLCHRNSDLLLCASASRGDLAWVQKSASGLDPALAYWEVLPHKLEDAGEAKPALGEGLLLKHVASGLYLTRGKHGEVVLARDAYFQPRFDATPAGSVDEEAPRLTKNKSAGLGMLLGRGGLSGEIREQVWEEEGERHLRGLWTLVVCRGGQAEAAGWGAAKGEGAAGARKMAGVVDGSVVWVRVVEGEEEAASTSRWLGTGPRIPARPVGGVRGDQGEGGGGGQAGPALLVREPSGAGGGGGGGGPGTLSRSNSQGLRGVGGEGAASARFTAAVHAGKQMMMQDAVEVRVVEQGAADDAVFLRRSRQVLGALLAVLSELEPAGAGPAEQNTERAVEEASRHPALEVLAASASAVVVCLRDLVRRCTSSANPDPLTRTGSPKEGFQECLRHFGILELAVQLVQCLFEDLRLPFANGVGKKLPVLCNVAELAYKLIEMACHENQSNKHLLVPYTNLFYNHKQGEVGAYFALLNVISGSRQAMDQLGENRFFEAEELLRTRRSTRLLRLLRVTCHCKETPIIENQDMWADAILGLPEIILKAEVKQRDVVLTDVRDGSVHSVKEIMRDGEEKVFGVEEHETTPGQEVLRYYVSMLELFGSLVLGRNERVSQKLLAEAAAFGVEEPFLRGMLGDGSMPYRLREACCILYSRLYVDQHPYREIPTLAPARVWSKLGGVKDAHAADAKEAELNDGEGCGVGEATCGYGRTLPSERLDELKSLLVQLTSDFRETDCEEVAKNRFANSVVQLCSNLFRFGFYHYRDPQTNRQLVEYPQIRMVCVPLFKLLDGRTDACRPLPGLSSDETRFELSEGTQTVMETKLRVLQLFNDFFRVSQNDGVSRLVTFWEQLLERRFSCTQWDWAVADIKVQEAADASNELPRMASTRSPEMRRRASERKSSVESTETVSSPVSRAVPRPAAPSPKAGALRAHRGRVADGKGEGGFADYAEHPELWEQAPPWSAEELAEVSNAIFGSELAILDEFSVHSIAAMFGRGNQHHFVPDWVKILLDLVRYKSLPLKQLAISTLLFSFSQYTAFVAVVRNVQLVCLPAESAAFFRVRGLIAGLRDRLPALRSIHNEQRKADAVGFSLRALAQLQSLCTVTMRRDRHFVQEVQAQIANLGGHEPALAILHMPLHASPPEEEGQLAEASDRRQLRLMREAYFFIARFCEEHRGNQKLVAPHLSLFRKHVEIRGTGVEVAMEAVAKDNPEVLRQVGMEWIAMLLGEVIPRYRCRRSRWLRVVEACVESEGKALKENQGLVMKLLRANQEMIASLFKGDQWDRRIELMRHVGSAAHAAIRRLDSEGHAAELDAPSQAQVVDTGNGSEVVHTTKSPGAMARVEAAATNGNGHGEHAEPGGEAWNQAWEEDVTRLDCPLEYHVGFLRLLEVCSHGKNPASEVHSSSFFSLEEVVHAIAGLDIRSDGVKEGDLKWSVVVRVRAAFCGLLLHVYVDTDVDRLLAEVRDNTHLFWESSEDDAPRPRPPVMPLLRDEFVRFVDWWVEAMRPQGAAELRGSREAVLMYEVARAMTSGIIPVLIGYFRRFGARLDASLSFKAVAEDIFDAALRLTQAQLVPEAIKIYQENGQMSCIKTQASELCRFIALKCKIRSEWVSSDAVHKGMTLEDMPDCFMHKMKLRRLKIALRRGLEELGKALGKFNGVTDTQRLIGLGHRQLAVMLSREGRLKEFYTEKRRGSMDMGREDPHYHTLVMSIVEACQEDAGTSTTVLVDILRALRASIYIYEPGKEEGNLSEYDEQWERFLDDQPVLKEDRGSGKELQDQILEYCQNKYDAMGVTSAALRLVSHPDITVQVNAARLLLALLQGCNRRVQSSIAQFLERDEGVQFFEAMKSVFDSSIDTLKDFKRTLKGLKGGTSGGSSAKESASARSFLSRAHTRRDDSYHSLRGLGRQSHLMISLRMLQLFCEGQFKPLQDAISGQAGKQVSVDLLNRMVALFEAAQPLVTDAMWFNDGDLVVLCMMIVDVLSETVQGPNTANQVALLQSNFLAVVNRLMSALMYSNLPDDRKKANGFDVSVNDLKCWLKTSILNCSLAMLEGVKDSEQPSQMLQFFEIKNLIQQMVTNGRLLGLLPAQEPQEQMMQEPHTVDADWGGACTEEAQAMQPDRPASLNSQKSQKRFARGFSLRGSGTRRASRSVTMHAPGSRRDSPAVPMHFADGYEDALEDEMFLFYFLMQMLAEYDVQRSIGIAFDSLEADHKALWEYLNTHSSQVELVRKDASSGQSLVERVYFRVTPEVLDLTSGRDFVERAKESLFSVPRQNPQEKARAFLGKLKEVRDQAGWLQYISRMRSKLFYIRYRDNFEMVPLLLSVLITVLLLLFYGIPVDPNTRDIVGRGRFYTNDPHPPSGYSDLPYPFANATSDPLGAGASYARILEQLDLALDFRLRLQSRWQSDEEWSAFPAVRVVVCVLAVIHCLFTWTNACGYLLFDYPLVLKQVFEEHFSQIDASGGQREHGHVSVRGERGAHGGLQRSASRRRAAEALKRGDSSNMQVKVPEARGNFFQNLPPVPKPREVEYSLALYWRVLRSSGQAAYWAFLTTISILGVIQSPFYYVAFMLDFFRRKDGRLVLDAIIVGGPNILRSFTLGVVGLVCFGFYTYSYFSATVMWEHDSCHTPFQCVVAHVLESMTGDLTSVLGDSFGAFAFPALVLWEDSWQAWRSFFVFVTIIFWVFLLQGIIQGQIIDTFAAMRNEKEAAREDLEQKCFVSSIDRFVFNNYPGEWEKRRGGKYAWQYLLFFIHLLDKDPEEYNGLENAVAESYKHNRIDFLPIEMFYARQREQLANIKAEAKADMTNMSSRVDSMETSLSELRTTSNRIMAMLRWKSAVNSMSSAVARS